MVISIDPLHFGSDYSMKNIPIPTKNEHQRKLIIQASFFINKLRWYVLNFLTKYKNNPNIKADSKSNMNDSTHFDDEHQTYGFRSERAAPFVHEYPIILEF